MNMTSLISGPNQNQTMVGTPNNEHNDHGERGRTKANYHSSHRLPKYCVWCQLSLEKVQFICCGGKTASTVVDSTLGDFPENLAVAHCTPADFPERIVATDYNRVDFPDSPAVDD